MRLVVFALCLLTTLLFAATASANPAGLAGYTGKPSSFAPQGESCNQCHTGGTAPTVTITGPDTLAAGQVAEYTVVVATALTRAGGAVAAKDGVLLAPSVGGGFRDSFGEMVQDGPMAVAGGQATFKFRMTAPLVGASVRLWAVGLAANANNANSGDRAAQTTKDVTITGGAPEPAPTADGGAPSPGGGANTGPGGTTPAGTDPNGDDDPANPNDDPNDPNDDQAGTAGPPGSRRRSSSPQAASCSVSASLGSDTDVGALVVCALFGIAGVSLRRRRAAR